MGRKRQRRAYLFLVRVWTEDSAEDSAWQGKVQRVVDGEAYEFNGWSGLIDLLRQMLADKKGG